MINIDDALKDFNLTRDDYENFLNDCSDKVNKILDIDWSEICEKYGIDFNPDTLRKGCQPPIFGSVFVRDYYLSKQLDKTPNEYSDEIDSKIRKLEKEKIKYRDERNAWNKQNYIEARVEQKLDYLENELKNIGKINFEDYDIPNITGQDEMIVLLSDWHIGQCFNSVTGEYNVGIAKNRLAQLYNSVAENAKLYNVKNVHVALCGDMISGSIHKSIQVTNSEDVINQIKIATEMVSSFCYNCCKIFENVYMYSVVGNHSRIDNKKEAIHSERLDDIIAWASSLVLKEKCENYHYFKHRNLDNGIVDINIQGNSYLLVHGDFDPSTKSGASNLSIMLGFIPKAILKGHLHTPSYNEYNGIAVIQGGSLAGSGDQYTLENRLYGKANQTILICNKNGIKVHMPVELY